MNRDQTTGIAERVLYGALLWLTMKGVAIGWFDAEMAAYLAAGGVTLAGAAWAWWINRPAALMNAASNQLPKNSALVITTSGAASGVEKAEASALANASNDKVSAKTTA